MPQAKFPSASTTGPKVPLKERGLKIGQELADNLNRNVAADNPQTEVPQPDSQPHANSQEEMLAYLRKSYPGVPDAELLESLKYLA